MLEFDSYILFEVKRDGSNTSANSRSAGQDDDPEISSPFVPHRQSRTHLIILSARLTCN